jgi:hypothetical protein
MKTTILATAFLLCSIAPVAAESFQTPGSTAVVTAGGYEGVTTDAFDLSKGVVIEDWTRGSYYDPYAGVGAMLGGPGYMGGDYNHTLFGDGFAAATLFNVQFLLPDQIWLGSIKLGFSQDGYLTRRGAAAYSLSVRYSDGTPDLLVSHGTLAGDYMQNYGDATITVSDTFAAVRGQRFVFNVTQRGDYYGPRVFELDGFTTVAPVPEPSTWAMAAAGVAAMVVGWLRRRWVA